MRFPFIVVLPFLFACFGRTEIPLPDEGAGGRSPARPSVTCSSCDDGNPCTLDACLEGSCVHDSESTQWLACDDWLLMQCQSGVCVPTVDPPDCSSDQDCTTLLGKPGICMAAVCWFSCEEDTHACDGMPFSDVCRVLHEGKDVRGVCAPPPPPPALDGGT